MTERCSEVSYIGGRGRRSRTRSTLRFISRMSVRNSRMSASQLARPCSTAPRRLPTRQAAPPTARINVAPTVIRVMMMAVASVLILLLR